MKESPTHPNDPDSDLIAMIAHDLRGPITAIKGFSQLALRRSDLSPQIRDCLTVTISEANRIASLIDDLVLVSQLSRRWNLHIGKVEMSTIVRMAIQRSRLLDTPTEFVLDAAAEAKAWCDPVITERAISLLIAAALKYCVGSDQVAIRLKPVENDVVVGVMPSGDVRKEKLPMLRRVIGEAGPAPTDELSPIGLNLYICRRLIEKQEGRVWIDQSPEARTRFMIALPRCST